MADVAAIEANMAEARRARAAGDVDRAARLLADAHGASTSLPPEHSIRAVVGWRLLKALFDLGRIEDLEKALLDLIELPHPFADGAGIRAAEPIARSVWDRLGYGRPAIRRLWARYIEHFEGAGDPWMAACGRAQQLWDEACAGDLDVVQQAIEGIACATPRTFSGGVSRHPRAPDSATSVFFAQIEQARIASWAAIWAHDEQLAGLALELYCDALAEAEQPEDYWFVECAARAELRFGRVSGVPSAVGRWQAAAAGLDHPRAALHQALALAELAPEQAVAQLAPQLPEADGAGPEWGVDVRRLLADAGERAGDDRAAGWRADAAHRIHRFGLGVFRRADAAADARSVG